MLAFAGGGAARAEEVGAGGGGEGALGLEASGREVEEEDVLGVKGGVRSLGEEGAPRLPPPDDASMLAPLFRVSRLDKLSWEDALEGGRGRGALLLGVKGVLAGDVEVLEPLLMGGEVGGDPLHHGSTSSSC